MQGGRGKLAEIGGLVPSLRKPIVGCAFAGRCPMVTDLCRKVAPAIEPKTYAHSVACHYAGEKVAETVVRMSGRPHSPLLEVNALKKHFPIHGGLLGQVTAKVYAVDGVTFDIRRGETLSLVGESGCGKSTVGKRSCACSSLTDGEVYLDGERIDNMRAGKLQDDAQAVQVVFQDPFSSLNPRMKVRDILAEPLVNFGMASGSRDLTAKVEALMDKVRLPRDAINRFPHEFSGGQRQRIGIARALAPGADLIICDEAVSALDVSVKAQIINLLADLQDELGLRLAVHQPRPGDGRAPDAPRRRDVPRQDRRTRRPPLAVRRVAPPYTKRPALRCSGARPHGEAPAHHPDRRRAQPDQPAERLPVSTHAVPSSSTAAGPRSQLLRNVGVGHLSACHLDEVPGGQVLPHAA